MQRLSALHPEKKQHKGKGLNIEKEIHVKKWQLPDWDWTINDSEDSRRPGNKHCTKNEVFH